MTRIARLSNMVITPRLLTEIDAIFFDSAGVKHFRSDDERGAYRELWLGRYIRHFPKEILVASDSARHIIGYLVGSPISNRPPLSGPDYYVLFPQALIEAYPAHLHVNVRQDCRGRSVGSELITVFRVDCRENRIPGFHAVTAAGTASAQFFTKCGLETLAEADWHGRQIVFMGDALLKNS